MAEHIHPSPNRPVAIHELIDAWVRLAWPDQLRSMRAAVADQITDAPPEAPDPDQAERHTRPMRWLLERCAAGVTLTQSGYLPPMAVAEAADDFGWWPFGGRPRSEVDVHQLQELRATARRLRLIISEAGGSPRHAAGAPCSTIPSSCGAPLRLVSVASTTTPGWSASWSF